MLSPAILKVLVCVLSTIIPAIHGQSTCGPKVSARLLMDIPCDMSKTPFCEISGTAYPWAAVRRYIYENQGLLRRMYGDQRHYQILTNEIQDLKEKYDNPFIFEKDTKYHQNKKLPQFRPRSIAVDDQSSLDGDEGDESSSGHEMPSSTPLSAKMNFSGPNETSYNQAYPLNEEETKKPTVATTTVRTMEEETSEDDGDDHPSRASFSTEETTMVTVNDLETSATTRIMEESSPMVTSESSMTPWDKGVRSSSSGDSSMNTSPASPSSSSSDIRTGSTSSSIDPASSTVPSVNSMPTPATAFEVKQEPTKEPEVAKKGVNACPVKEEVIAPYWANNTRGEILALLNVYPFEQYVHWEKCAYENSQMFCRTGCRCEQQYRLHRLLAFDPKNECRGVFADWFRFPSCCVCICYDLPESNVFYKSKRRKSRL